MPNGPIPEEFTAPPGWLEPPAPVDTRTRLREAIKAAPSGIQIESDQLKALRGALGAGKWGAIIGGGLGALRAAMAPKEERNYLRDTLAGALLGAVGAGGTAYLARSSPFARGGAGAKGFEAGKAVALARMLQDPSATPTDVARESVSAALGEILSGRHEFGPEEQQALVQQFVKAKVPTSTGWRRRIDLADRAIRALVASPETALPALKTLERVAPDPEMRAYATEARGRIETGRAATPEGRHALATFGRMMADKVKDYRTATHTIDALNVMKELYGRGEILPTDVAKNIGLITGRFGPATASAEKIRRIVQSSISPEHAIEPHPPAPYPAAPTGSEVSRLVTRAMR